MTPKLLVRSIAAATVLLAGATSAAVPNAGAMALGSTMSLTAQYGAQAQGADYFVVFHEDGVMSYDGGIAALSSTQAARTGGPLQTRDSSVVAYRDYLGAQRQAYLQALAAQVSDSALKAQLLNPAFVYDLVFHGVGLQNLTEAQAQALRAAPGVKEVTLAPVYELDTDRVEAFIGAGSIWSGTATPASNPGSRGEGAVIAVIDTGLTASHTTHGSFRNDTTCGLDSATPKIISALDCTTGSACAGSSPYSVNNPHGSHVASTVGGNDHVSTGGDLSGQRVSGVAPCAQIFSLKACATTSCAGLATSSAAQKVIEMQADYGITAVNYSIGGGTSPWSSSDINRAFLDMVDAGIFVAASAGNTRDTAPNPVGAVNHRGPWVTTVANSTHDRVSSNNVDTDMGGPTAQYGLKGGMNFSSDVTGDLVAPAASNTLGCDPYGAGALSGKILLVSRGDCSFEIKVNNAIAAGATGVVVFNNTPSPFPIAMGGTETSTIPAVMVSGPVGADLSAHLAANLGTKATIRGQTSYLTSPSLGDVLSDSSLRGPVPASHEITKPDITGPGTNIFAAYDAGPNSYDYMSGTSMSGPHIAGAGALVKSVQPSWTAMEVRSALMTTAQRAGDKDFLIGTGQWDADDVGNGRLDLTRATLAGLVMHETKTNFLAASGSVTNMRGLNIPSMRNVSCTPNCTFTRTVRNTLSTAKTWTATADGGGKMAINISPASFSFTGDLTETQDLTITVTPQGNQSAAMAFGHVLLNSTGSPEQNMTVSIKGTGAISQPTIKVTPENVNGTADEGSTTAVSRPLNIANIGTSGALEWEQINTLSRPVNAASTVLVSQPATGSDGIVSSWSTAGGGAFTAADFVLTASADLEKLTVYGFRNQAAAAPPKIRWSIYADDGGSPAGNADTGAGAAPLWTQELSGTAAGVTYDGGEIELDLAAAGLSALNLDAGTYWLSVAGIFTTALDDTRWNWFMADQVNGPSKLVGAAFGVASWTSTGTGGLATTIQDVAMTIEGTQGAIDCNASWLSMNPVSGTVNASQSQDAMVQLNPTGLAVGTHMGNLCLSSNDPANPEVVIPVAFEIQGEQADEADLALALIAQPNPVEAGDALTAVANVNNLGPAQADDVTVTFALPGGMSPSSLVYVLAETGDISTASAGGLLPTAGTWACAPASSQVICSFDEALAANSAAPSLEVTILVASSTAPGTYPLTGTVASNKTDPAPTNNSVTLDIAVTAQSDVIFADGFDGASGGICAPLQLLQDPGFEASTASGNPFWASTSANGGTSLCNNDCAADPTDPLSRTGDWFVWFGGWGAVTETGTVTQSVVIPGGSDRFINYWLRREAGDATTSQMTISIDGTVISTVTRGTGIEDAYAPYALQVPASYADGNSHAIEFKFSKTGSGQMANFFVDDVSLDCAAQPTGGASSTMAEGRMSQRRSH